MATAKIIQTNFTAGYLDPLMAAREDTEIYYNGLAAAENIVVQPVGGITARFGTKKIARVLNTFSKTDLSTATLTAPNGGTANNIRDDNENVVFTTSSNFSTTNPFVIIQIDLGSVKSISAIDIINYMLSSGSLDGEVFIQHSLDASSWNNYGTALNWTTDKRSRRRSGAMQARYIRLVRIGSTSLAATATVGEIVLYQESAIQSNVRLAPFSDSTNESYMMAITDKNCEVMLFDSVVGSISVPYSSANLSVLNWTQSLDTMLLFHMEHQPYKIFRQGANDQFDFRKQDFSNIPKSDYGAGTGGINEIQVLNDGGTFASGDKITVLLEGKRTVTITGGATRTDSATAIQTALNNLENTAGGITVAQTADGFTVTFGGADGNQPWQTMDVSVMKGNSVWTVSRTTEGDYPGESVVSDTRGWFRCGTLYQGRLHMVGAKSKPNAIISSKVGEFFDLDINTDDDTAGLFLPIDSNNVSAAFQIVPGRNLTIFTQAAEFYLPKEPIDATGVTKLQTSVGIKEGLRVHEMDGALIFIQGDGASVREFIYTDTELAYQANNLSYKAASLLNSPVDIDLRRAINADETDQLYIVNADGSMAVMSAMRSQSVPGAFTKFTLSNGKILAVGVDARKRVYIATERTINGSPVRFVELFDADFRLDCARKIDITAENNTATAGQTVFSYSFSSPATVDAVGVRLNGGRLSATDYVVNLGAKTITLSAPCSAGDSVRISSMIKTVSGITDMNGATLSVIADGTPVNNVTVSAGSFTMDDYADTSIEYGFDFAVGGELLPPRIAGQETLTGRKVRIPRLILSLYETECIEVSVNDGPYREIPMVSMDDDILDKSQADLKFTGTKDIRGILGWGNGVVKFRRPRPGKMTIRTITREVAI